MACDQRVDWEQERYCDLKNKYENEVFELRKKLEKSENSNVELQRQMTRATSALHAKHDAETKTLRLVVRVFFHFFHFLELIVCNHTEKSIEIDKVTFWISADQA